MDVPGARPPGLLSLALPGTGSLVVEQTALPAAWLWSRALISPNVPFPTGTSGRTCVVSSGQETGAVCQVPSTPSNVGGHFSISPLLPCFAVGVEMGHSWSLLGFLCGVSLLATGWSPLGLEASLCCLGLPLAESPWPWPRGYRIIRQRLFPRLEADLSELQPWHH